MNFTATIEGIGFWCRGLPSWDAARACVRDGTLPEAPPTRPSPQLLAPNERRRAPETVAVALEVALAACDAAGREATQGGVAFQQGDLGAGAGRGDCGCHACGATADHQYIGAGDHGRLEVRRRGGEFEGVHFFSPYLPTWMPLVRRAAM